MTTRFPAASPRSATADDPAESGSPCSRGRRPRESRTTFFTFCPSSTRSVAISHFARVWLAGAAFASALSATDAATANEPEPPGIVRYVAVDNVCAWPNLIQLGDGSIAAIIHNQPSHGRVEGDIDCWVSPDGVLWEKRANPTPNDPGTVRMNVGAGRARNGDLLVLCSAWAPTAGRPDSRIIPAWVSRSSDGGRTWAITKSFPEPEPGWTDFVPFGPILPGPDGKLHTACYARGLADPTARSVWHFTSSDDGRTWQRGSLIGANHNETSIFHVSGREWLAASRTNPLYRIELFRSTDNGVTWQAPQPVTQTRELNAHLLRLKDGRILMSYGKRLAGHSGVLAKFSRDEGRTWSAPFRLMHSLAMDCGYPSSVQRADGKIVTAYYSASVENHNRYHMGVAIWDAPEAAP